MGGRLRLKLLIEKSKASRLCAELCLAWVRVLHCLYNSDWNKHDESIWTSKIKNHHSNLLHKVE